MSITLVVAALKTMELQGFHLLQDCKHFVTILCKDVVLQWLLHWKMLLNSIFGQVQVVTHGWDT